MLSFARGRKYAAAATCVLSLIIVAFDSWYAREAAYAYTSILVLAAHCVARFYGKCEGQEKDFPAGVGFESADGFGRHTS
jgi:hypothetical protein